MGDLELLQAYAKHRSEPAFTELVRHHLDWVYSAARRQVGDPHLAEDVAQSVFVLLARKANNLRTGTSCPAGSSARPALWLPAPCALNNGAKNAKK